MTEWNGQYGWEEAKNRSEDFKNHFSNRYTHKIMEEVTGKQGLYMRPGDKNSVSLWCAIAGISKKLEENKDFQVEWLSKNAERISKVEDQQEEIEEMGYGELASEVSYLRKKVVELEERLEDEETGDEVEITEEEIEEPEAEVPDLDVEKIVRQRRRRRDELTEKQETVFKYVLENPDASKVEIQQMSGMNWPNTINSLRTILNKNYQLPIKFCNRFGLETEFSGENKVSTGESIDNADRVGKRKTVEA